jgi:DNA polymerase III subunit chi
VACEVWFYHLERSGLDLVLPELLEKTLARGWRALVKALDRDRIEHLDGWLWSYRPESFLPHGVADDVETAPRQPVLLTRTGENLNGAQILFLVDGAEAGVVTAEAPTGERPLTERLASYERCMVLFDGRDEDAVTLARSRWREVKAAGLEASYWRQGEGGWRKQA